MPFAWTCRLFRLPYETILWLPNNLSQRPCPPLSHSTVRGGGVVCAKPARLVERVDTIVQPAFRDRGRRRGERRLRGGRRLGRQGARADPVRTGRRGRRRSAGRRGRGHGTGTRPLDHRRPCGARMVRGNRARLRRLREGSDDRTGEKGVAVGWQAGAIGVGPAQRGLVGDQPHRRRQAVRGRGIMLRRHLGQGQERHSEYGAGGSQDYARSRRPPLVGP